MIEGLLLRQRPEGVAARDALSDAPGLCSAGPFLLSRLVFINMSAGFLTSEQMYQRNRDKFPLSLEQIRQVKGLSVSECRGDGP